MTKTLNFIAIKARKKKKNNNIKMGLQFQKNIYTLNYTIKI